MRSYQFSCKVSDSIFGSAVKVVSVDATSIPEAVGLASQVEGVLEVGTLLGSIDRQPQVFLAW